MKLRILLSLTILLSFIGSIHAQTVIEGKVTDAESGDPIPFANVVIKGTSVGSPTDFDGFYRIEGDAETDTIMVSFIGYEVKHKIYQKGVTQTINFQLAPEAKGLDDFVVFARKQENPAFAIMRSVIDNKGTNDKRTLDAYEYDSYNKIQIDVDNISQQLRDKKYMQKITAVLDSIEVIAGEDGKPVLPLFISESLSKFYYRDDPRLQKEEIERTRIKGVAIEDGSLISQIIGSSFQEYNFYQNRMNIVDKEFASPIGDAWRLIYDYELQDSLYLGDEFVYLLEFKPKNDQELAFFGKLWITKSDFAIRQIDATMQPTANLNFIDRIKIQQELERTETGAWLPIKSRILIDASEVTKKSAGFLAKFYSSNKNIKVTEPKPTKFFERTIELAEDARYSDEDFWQANRHDKLSDTEVSVMAMIDSLNNIRFVKTWTNILKTVARGYFEVGKLDLGPWPFLFGINDVEGPRIRLGGRTNENFSRKWQFNGYGAYGFTDEKFKYGLGANVILNREKWTTITASYRNDIDQFGVQLDPITASLDGSAFLALTQLGNLVRPFRYERYEVDGFRQFSRSFSAGLQLKKQNFNPLFDFRYRTDLSRIDSPIASDFETTEATLVLKFARDETFLINDNSRFSLGTLRWPTFLLSYTRGFKTLGGDFNYNRLNFGVSQRIKLGFWGVSRYQVNAGHIFEDVPYPLLTSHIGNEQFVYTDIAYNTMNFFEFSSQSFASLSWQHNFEGFVFNRIPLLRKLKWRLVGTGNLLFGGVSQSTIDAQIRTDEGGNDLPFFNALENGRPFAEVGLGIENIFKVFRVDFIRRLTYLESVGADKTAIKLSFNLSL